MKHVILVILLAVLKESYPLNPEILKYDHYMKDFEATGRQLKREENKKINAPIVKREDQNHISSTSSSTTSSQEMTIEEKFEILLMEFIQILSGKNDLNAEHLTTPYEKELPSMNPCYLKTMRQFQDYCCQYYDKFGSVMEFKQLFHRACEATWLDTEEIGERIKKTCEENPQLTQIWPSTETRFTYSPYKFTFAPTGQLLLRDNLTDF